jgi:hypothetical protein
MCSLDASQGITRQTEQGVCVRQGPYVLVMVNTGRSHKSNRLQASWLVSAYRGLSRPFRKNVKFIILVRPSKPLKAFLTMLRPFLSRKAHRKVIKVCPVDCLTPTRHTFSVVYIFIYCHLPSDSGMPPVKSLQRCLWNAHWNILRQCCARMRRWRACPA